MARCEWFDVDVGQTFGARDCGLACADWLVATDVTCARVARWPVRPANTKRHDKSICTRSARISAYGRCVPGYPTDGWPVSLGGLGVGRWRSRGVGVGVWVGGEGVYGIVFIDQNQYFDLCVSACRSPRLRYHRQP